MEGVSNRKGGVPNGGCSGEAMMLKGHPGMGDGAVKKLGMYTKTWRITFSKKIMDDRKKACSACLEVKGSL